MSADPGDKKAAEIEAVISSILFGGVWASLGLVAAGTALCFFRSGVYGSGAGSAEDLRRLLTAGQSFPRSLGALASGWARLDGTAVIVTGLLLLIATPVVRVAVSIVAFAAVRDRRYVLITTVVLALLILSFVLGQAG